MLVACVILMTGCLSQTEQSLSILARSDLVCPVCEQSFQTIVCSQHNTRCGVDRDLFARALGPQPVFYHISTCPQCGYSGYVSDFTTGSPVDPETRKKVLGQPGLKLPKDFTPASDPRELDASDRYALAIQCYQWRKKSNEALAWLALRASWVEREKGSILPPDARLKRVMAYIERWRPPLEPTGNQADLELKTATRVGEAVVTGHFNRYQEPYAKLALALILRRHGENHHALDLLDDLATRECFSPSIQEGIARMKASIRKERVHQEKAADLLSKALTRDELAGENKAAACYLLGELYRRLDRDEQAASWFDKASKNPDLPEGLSRWLAQQRNGAAAADNHGAVNNQQNSSESPVPRSDSSRGGIASQTDSLARSSR